MNANTDLVASIKEKKKALTFLRKVYKTFFVSGNYRVRKTDGSVHALSLTPAEVAAEGGIDAVTILLESLHVLAASLKDKNMFFDNEVRLMYKDLLAYYQLEQNATAVLLRTEPDVHHLNMFRYSCMLIEGFVELKAATQKSLLGVVQALADFQVISPCKFDTCNEFIAYHFEHAFSAQDFMELFVPMWQLTQAAKKDEASIPAFDLAHLYERKMLLDTEPEQEEVCVQPVKEVEVAPDVVTESVTDFGARVIEEVVLVSHAMAEEIEVVRSRSSRFFRFIGSMLVVPFVLPFRSFERLASVSEESDEE